MNIARTAERKWKWNDDKNSLFDGNTNLFIMYYVINEKIKGGDWVKLLIDINNRVFQKLKNDAPIYPEDWMKCVDAVRGGIPCAEKDANGELKKGKWIKTPFIDKYLCFNCNREYDRSEIENLRIDYCMSCGAKNEKN